MNDSPRVVSAEGTTEPSEARVSTTRAAHRGEGVLIGRGVEGWAGAVSNCFKGCTAPV